MNTKFQNKIISNINRQYEASNKLEQIKLLEDKLMKVEEIPHGYLSNAFIPREFINNNFTDEEIDTAIRISQAKEFIDKIPEGLDKELSAKGTNVSGGQRQRILIARAVISNPEILILDDASSALDYKTDAALRKEIRENLNHTTSIIVTQRVSSVSYCEQILVLSDGEEVGIGNHETLLKSVPLYKEIYDIQMGGEMNE